jgi:hypothetical protein
MKEEDEIAIRQAHVMGSKFHDERDVWKGILARCQNPNNAAYKNYGGRGITVCERWQSFRNFIYDMGPRPKGLFIERIDNDLGYCPSNCKWATWHEQSRNRRNNRIIEFNGKSQCLADWAEETGINRNVIAKRLNTGWSIKRALTVPMTKRVLITFDGESLSVLEWSKRTGLSANMIRHRLRNGKSADEVLSQRKGRGKVYEFEGEARTIPEWSRHLGFSRDTISQRLQRGWSFSDAISVPSKDVSGRIIEFQGKSQKISEWAIEIGVKLGTLKSRLQNGWSIEKTLTTGPRIYKNK